LIMAFKRADKKQTFLRMALLGPAGSGKSFTALRIAHALAQGEPIAAFDTERRSLSKYAGDPNPDGGGFEFDVDDDMPDFDVRRYIHAIQEAEKAGYKVMVIDSLSHAWAGVGGILEFVDGKKGNSNNGFSAWRDATPMHNRLVDTILSSKMHVIVTMRTKMGYVQEKDEKGRTVVRKVGLQPIQREGVEYEFDVIADMEGTTMSVSKTRCSRLQGKRFLEPGRDVAKVLLDWLYQGEAGDPRPAREQPTLREVPREPVRESVREHRVSAVAEHVEPTLELVTPAGVSASEEQQERVALCLLRAGLDRYTGDIPVLIQRLQDIARKRQQPTDVPSVIARLEGLSEADLTRVCERIAA